MLFFEDQPITPAEQRDLAARLLPVVRMHPVSGRQGLSVNEGFTVRIVELHPTESDAVLRQRFAHVARPGFTVRWRWKLGDVAFRDNRPTRHHATSDDVPAGRVMHRATIMGDAPFHRAAS